MQSEFKITTTLTATYIEISAIKEYASRRFSAYASQLKVDKIKSFKSEADTLIRVTEVYKELVEDGTLTQQRADEKLKKKFEDLQETFSVVSKVAQNNHGWVAFYLNTA